MQQVVFVLKLFTPGLLRYLDVDSSSIGGLGPYLSLEFVELLRGTSKCGERDEEAS